VKRKLFIASTISSALASCSPIGTALNNNETFHKLIGSAQGLNHAVIGTRGMARLYTDADVDHDYRVNGFAPPSSAKYQHILATNYAAYRLVVDGAVNRPHVYTLDELQKMPQLNQVTRHDCVEGWSVIGKFGGVPLHNILDAVEPRSDARYVVFHCMDTDEQGTPYYESLDMHQARHPQTMLALRLNDAPIDPKHGAPVRLRVPTQLGYKSAKWVYRLEFVGSYANIAMGYGGYWEDEGYEWYAGI
jgi:DMSO/TMAO reductase YedYZ molybdopterin-dependent catalytic subunit